MGALAFQPNSRRAFALAVALLVIAVALQWLLRPLIGPRAPFLLLYPAVGIAAMWGGWRPALLVLVGALLHATAWLYREGDFDLDSFTTWMTLVGFVVGAGLLVALGGRISQLRARAVEAEARMRSQVKDLNALHELSERVAPLPALEPQLQAIITTLCELEGACKGVILLRDERRPDLHAVAAYGFSSDSMAGELQRVPVGAGACGAAVDLRRPVLVQDVDTDPLYAPYRELARREGFRSVYSQPLLNPRGESIGVLSMHFPQPRPHLERDHRLANLCARMAAVLAERDAALRQATATSRKLEVALDSSAVPFCLVQPVRDADGRVITFAWEYLNAAAASLLQRPAGDLIGRQIRQTLSDTVVLEPALLEKTRLVLQNQRTMRFETSVLARGMQRWFEAIASPHEDGLAVWFSDVTARKQQEEARREADRRKDEFLATLAHELRNPLAPIRQAARVARSPEASEARRQWSYDVIERQIGHMAMLLDDLLDVSRITRGKLELRRSVLPLAQAVASALETAQPLFEARRQHLATRLPERNLWLEADGLRLSQVLSNLLVNASKYTQEGSHVELSARAEADGVRLEVKDDGPGIAADALDRIFEMFTQVRSEGPGAHGGLGIGLALSRGLVELHGGTLVAESDGPGRGSRFVVRLPGVLRDEPLASGDAAPAAATRTLRILVADDNQDAAQSLAELLRMEGHDVGLAFDGHEALEQFIRLQPQVVLLDIGMPGMTGNEVAQAIRERDPAPRPLLIAITGWGQERDREAAQAAGFDFHFTKPVDPAQVLRLLGERFAVPAAPASVRATLK